MLKVLKTTPKTNVFRPFTGSTAEEQLLRAGAIRYESDQPHPYYGCTCRLDGHENVATILDTTVLAYETTTRTKSGYVVWDCTDQVVIGQDSIIYAKSAPVLAARIICELPVFLYGEAIASIPGGWMLQTSGDTPTRVQYGDGYWLYAGPGRVSVLTPADPDFTQYWVLSPTGDFMTRLANHRD